MPSISRNILTPEELAALLDTDAKTALKEAPAGKPPASEAAVAELTKEIRRLQRTVQELTGRVESMERQIAVLQASSETAAAVEAPQASVVAAQQQEGAEAPVSRIEKFGRKKSGASRWFT